MEHSGPNEQPYPKAEQSIRGAEATAEFIFGDRTSRRKVATLEKHSQ
ncbi:MAG TPA: hypothetical protein VMT72_02470 [Pseudolabrys sp.]|nr:hypothetical protein [Pseudolabrys sp.]